ncbi:MAG: NHL repeat-containing protein [Gemmatimonadales bacterium]|nr:NHL repeat-containing protein [Gemmatimonadales bacterium]
MGTAAVAARTWLGAPAPGGLLLPSALPTPSTMYGPRGVHLDDARLIVVDSGNHRVLIWHDPFPADHQPADVVLGQASWEREGPRAAGRGAANGFHLPTGVALCDGRLVLADAWHHRLLVWDEVPRTSDVPPDRVIGQPGPVAIEPNRGGDVSPRGFYWPYGVAWIDGRLWVADTGNRRVLAWDGLPDDGRPADLVLGQPHGGSGEENGGGAPSARSFRWPHGFARTATHLWVADAGNHRVLGWRGVPGAGRDADVVLGQRDFAATLEVPHRPQGPAALRFPYAVAAQGDTLAVADTSNNRILCWDGAPAEAAGAPAQRVLGQADFGACGENRWTAVADDTLCWPYGLSWHGDRLAIADSGNNRVLVWTLAAAGR